VSEADHPFTHREPLFTGKAEFPTSATPAALLVTQMPHCSAQYGQCVATVRSAMNRSLSKRHTTLSRRDRVDFGLNSRLVPEARTSQRDDLVGVVSMSNKIVSRDTAAAESILTDEVKQSVLIINSM
jgi:hypothetical protein